MVLALLDQKLIFVTGKGGVGKSTVALALAQGVATLGKKALLASMSTQNFAASLSGIKNVTFYEPHELEKNIWFMTLDPQKAMHEYILRQIKLEFLYRLVFENRVVRYFLDATPGLNDLLVLGKIWDLVEGKDSKRFDTVIIDMPATGHGFNALRIPQVVQNMIPTGPLHKRAELMDQMLHNPRLTSVCLVTLAEEMAVNETLELSRSLKDELGLPLDAIFVNALYADMFPAEVSATATGDYPLMRKIVSCATSQFRRFSSQNHQYSRLRSSITGPQIIPLPFMFEHEFSLTAIRALSQSILSQVEGSAQDSKKKRRVS